MKVSVVIPVFNEEGNIQPLYTQLSDLLVSLNTDFEILFIDDGSTDHSFERLKDLHQKDPRVKVLSLSRNFGHQLALTAGMDHAEGDVCILMDADLQHPPEVLRNMIARWREGYEIVYTVRRSTQGARFFKRWAERLFYGLFRRFTSVDLSPNTADFRLLDRRVILAFRGIRERTRFLRGLTAWVGYRSTGLMYDAPERRSGTSKYSFFKMCQLAIDGLISFSAFPLYAATYVGLFLTLVGTCYIPYAAYIHYIAHRGVPGWASLMTAVCWIGGIQLFLLGVVGFYIAKIYDEVKQRPLYLLRQSLGVASSS